MPPTGPTLSIPGLDRAYHWQEAWGDLPATSDAGAWAHPGLAVDAGGDVHVVDADRPEVHVLDSGGALRRTISLPVTEAHGLLLDLAGPEPAIWVADPGFKLRVRGPERIQEGPSSGRVVKVDLAGRTLLEIGTPPHPAYREKAFKPTALELWGPPADRTLWIADGYGAGLVHRYRPDGTWLGSIDGGGDGLRFQTPHAVFMDTRGREPELLVTDRVGKQLQAFDLGGGFKRTIASGVLTSPSALAVLGDLLIVGELNASLAVLDAEGQLVGRVGDRVATVSEPDWPNARDGSGALVRSPRIAAGGFHAPHGLAIGPDGSIFVAEFVVGGRLVRLAPNDG